MSIAGVVLAAGFSRRLGRPKQEEMLGGETLLERAIRTAIAADLAPVIAVVHEPRWTNRLRHLDAHVVINENAAEGMSSSLVAGLRYAQKAGAAGVVVLTCDQPLLRPAHLRALCANRARITASAYAGRIGVPAYFPATALPALIELRGDQGARDLLQHAASVVNEDLALDIDTEADLLLAEGCRLEHVRDEP